MEEANILLEELINRLQAITFEQENIFIQTEQCIRTSIEIIAKLKRFVLEYTFNYKQEEILFFKKIKPKFFSQLIFYNKILSIETKRPIGSDINQRKYFYKELDKLKYFFDNNLDFYQYYRTGATYLDEKYYLRGSHDIHLALDSFIFDSDPQFCIRPTNYILFVKF